MLSRVYVVGVWCLLTLTTPNWKIDKGPGGGGAIPSVNYGRLRALVTRSKAVFVGGTLIGLNEWLTAVRNGEYESESANWKTMYTFLKCECADHVATAVAEIHELLLNCPTDDGGGVGASYRAWPDVKRCDRAVAYLKALDENVSLALTALLAISDYHPDLRSHEPYFLKTLLMTYLYAESKRDETAPSSSSSPRGALRTQRVVLQIRNLVRAFTAEHCYASTDRAIESPVHFGRGVDQQAPYGFREFLDAIAAFDAQRPRRRRSLLIDVDDFMLSDCVMFHAPNGAADLQKLCGAVSRNAVVRIITATSSADNGANNYCSLAELFASVRHTYDVRAVYEYMSIVYKVLLKLIYQETRELLREAADDVCCTVERLAAIKTKLQTMRCPVEMIHHFEFLLRVKTLGGDANETAARLNEIKLDSVDADDVDLRFKLSDVKLTFAEFVDVVLGLRFRQFWSVFDLLRRESETQSAGVYDLSTLDLFAAEAGAGFPQYGRDNDVKCAALTDVYLNYFKVESANNRSMLVVLENLNQRHKASLEEVDEHFRLVRKRNATFSHLLLELFENPAAAERLNGDRELLNIVNNAIVHLNNRFNDSVDVQKLRELQPPTVARLMIDKHEKLNRTGDLIMAMLDNYQIRRCPVIRDRDYVFRNVYADIRDRHVERFVAIDFHRGTNDSRGIKYYKTEGNGGGDRAAAATTTGGGPVRGKNPFVVRASSSGDGGGGKNESYDMARLTAMRGTEELKSLGTDIVFDWHGGGGMSVRDIRTDVAENMLNMRDLVEYQRLYVHGTFLFLLQNAFDAAARDNRNRPAAAAAGRALPSATFAHDFHVIDGQRKTYRVLYAASPNALATFAFDAVLKSVYDDDDDDDVRDTAAANVACPMSKTLGVVQVVRGVRKSARNTAEMADDDVCSGVFSSKSSVAHMIDKDFVLFKRTSPRYRFAVPGY